MSITVDPAEAFFEPTGELERDYSAYCEILQLPERRDVTNAVSRSTTPVGVTTALSVRNVAVYFNRMAMVPLAFAIPHCATLTKIYFVKCGMTEGACRLLAEAAYKSPSLTTLAIDFNDGFADDTGPTPEVYVTSAHYRGAHLTTPEEPPKDERKAKDVRRMQQKEEHAVEKILTKVPHGWHALLLAGIQVLSLRSNNIDDAHLSPLCKLLANHQELQVLSLWGNCIGDAGAALLAKALRENRKLLALNLGHNDIGDAGFTSLVGSFISADLPLDQVAQLRQRLHLAGDMPQYPTFMDLAAMSHPTTADDRKDARRRDHAKSRKVEQSTDRARGEFDRDCIRVDEDLVRVPGNMALVSINLTHNLRITTEAVVQAAHALLAREPTIEEMKVLTFVQRVPPYVAGVVALESIHLRPSEALAATAVQQLQKAIGALPRTREKNP